MWVWRSRGRWNTWTNGPARWAVEVCAFDAAKVLDPDVEGSAYQRGPLWRTNLRGLVMARDGHACLYCGARGGPLTLDHVIAASRGGADGAHNRVPACRRCNAEKGPRALEAWLGETERAAVRRRAGRSLTYAAALAAGKVKLDHLAAANVVAPAIATALESAGEAVRRTTGADTAAWRTMADVAKTHAADAACTALQGTPARWVCERPLRIAMTGRGRRRVVARNASGFPRLRRNGRIVASHRARPPHDIRTGDTVTVEDAGRRTRLGVARTARHDGRCVVERRDGARVNVMAARLTVVHRTCGARVQ